MPWRSASCSSPIPTWSSDSRNHAPLNDWDTATFYSGGEQGYVDYPVLQSDLAAAAMMP